MSTPTQGSTFRIISMVPSWTHMLLSLNIRPVGRTRFCIEPKPDVSTIPMVGGTKDWNLNLVHYLTPDLIILDKDENPKSMSEDHSIPFVATQVHDIKTCIEGIELIAAAITPSLPETQAKFETLLTRWRKIAASPPKSILSNGSLDKLPGLIQWIKKPTSPIKAIHYVIWRNPWMQVTKETFIGDVARQCGFELSASSTVNRYPELDLNTLDPDSTLLLFSSEPYPFHKKMDELKDLPFPSAIVDGQNFSWFGTYSLKFLESLY